MSNEHKEVIIDYTNWRGERALRRILPLSLSFENNQWHPETQWILEAVDVEKNVIRGFALANIHSWSPPLPKTERSES
jgi:predicted DNA-binding transcriptional regulator YafY